MYSANKCKRKILTHRQIRTLYQAIQEPRTPQGINLYDIDNKIDLRTYES